MCGPLQAVPLNKQDFRVALRMKDGWHVQAEFWISSTLNDILSDRTLNIRSIGNCLTDEKFRRRMIEHISCKIELRDIYCLGWLGWSRDFHPSKQMPLVTCFQVKPLPHSLSKFEHCQCSLVPLSLPAALCSLRSFAPTIWRSLDEGWPHFLTPQLDRLDPYVTNLNS